MRRNGDAREEHGPEHERIFHYARPCRSAEARSKHEERHENKGDADRYGRVVVTVSRDCQQNLKARG